MDDATYQALGSPSFAKFTWYVGTFEERSLNSHLLTGQFGDVDDQAIDNYHYATYGEIGNVMTFTVTKVCLGGDGLCSNVEIDSPTRWGAGYSHEQTLDIPVPDPQNADTAPVIVSFKKFYGESNHYWLEARVQISSESYQALGEPSSIKYRYYGRAKRPTFKTNIVPYGQGKWWLEKTDDSYPVSTTNHFYFILTQVCLENIDCVNTKIKVTSYHGGYEEAYYEFTIPDD